MTPAQQLQADVQQILCEPLRVRDGWEGRVDDAIRVVLEAAINTIEGDRRRWVMLGPGHGMMAAISELRSLMPPEKGER